MVINDAQRVRVYGSNILHFERVRGKKAQAIMPHSAMKYIRPFLMLDKMRQAYKSIVTDIPQRILQNKSSGFPSTKSPEQSIKESIT